MITLLLLLEEEEKGEKGDGLIDRTASKQFLMLV